jgi:hypothetical protein
LGVHGLAIAGRDGDRRDERNGGEDGGVKSDGLHDDERQWGGYETGRERRTRKLGEVDGPAARLFYTDPMTTRPGHGRARQPARRVGRGCITTGRGNPSPRKVPSNAFLRRQSLPISD